MKALVNHLAMVGVTIAGLAIATVAQAQTPLTFQLNWTAGGPNAGFAAALGEGFYKQAGLDVTIVQGNGSGNTAQLVASGRAQVAYADAVPVSQLIARGAPMRIVSTIYQSNPNEVTALKKTGIKSLRDLVGKKVGVPAGSSQAPMLPLFLRANGLKVITHPPLSGRSGQALTVLKMVPKTSAPGVRRAVSTTVRMSASPLAAHMAR